MMENSLKQDILSSLGYAHLQPEGVLVEGISGGSINQAAWLKIEDKSFFVKWNDANRYPLMFEKEASGLRLLNKANAFHIPRVFQVGQSANQAFLILDWIDSRRKAANFWQQLGEGLVKLHKQTNPHFGLDEDNYIGSLFQPNDPMDDWITFYITQRLDFQMEQAYDAGHLHRKHLNQFQTLYKALPNIIPQEKPALLHGDLWSGNYLVGENGEPVIVDPAVYYGHREMDLAMMKLFGGFDEQVFRVYHDHFPLEKGWENRVPIHQLYPLMVHVNLFGRGYVGQVESALAQFT